MVGDIINEAKMANAIVQEILDFVRPVRLQMERTSPSALRSSRRSAWPIARASAARSA